MSCLFLHSRFPQHRSFLEVNTPVIAGHHQGREWKSHHGTCSVTLGLLFCFSPFQANKSLSVECPPCLLSDGFPFPTNPTYFLLLKKSSLLLDPLRASFLDLGPHFEFIFNFILFPIIFRDLLWERSCSKVEIVILWQKLVTLYWTRFLRHRHPPCSVESWNRRQRESWGRETEWESMQEMNLESCLRLIWGRGIS